MALAWLLAVVVLMAYDPFDVGVVMILVVPVVLVGMVYFLRAACRGILWRPLLLDLMVHCA